tara:strand:+ start:154 stop:468 length:315 start_codon:yes stop_codon:yes gene_type:complete
MYNFLYKNHNFSCFIDGKLVYKHIGDKKYIFILSPKIGFDAISFRNFNYSKPPMCGGKDIGNCWEKVVKKWVKNVEKVEKKVLLICLLYIIGVLSLYLFGFKVT